MDHSGLRQPFICLHYISSKKESSVSIFKKTHTHTQMGDYHPHSCFQASPGISSHLGFVSSGLCLRSVRCANKEREGVRGRESEDVLIKGNSEGLNQIILHNLVREDTAFDTEKMEMTCPQRHVPMAPSNSL